MSDFRERVARAEKQMRSVFAATPLQRNDFLSGKYKAEIYLKREDLSPVRSYKIRGAFNAIVKALEAGKSGPFVCASAGNHAQGVAYACAHFGVQAVIYMPITTPKQKVHKTGAFGGSHAEIRLEGDYFDETLKAAQTYCAEAGAIFVPPFDSEDVIEGQATVGAEIMAQMPEDETPDMLVLPVGGGGLSAGITRLLGDSVEYRFVEPAGGPSLRESLKAGELITLPKVDSFVDGAAVARIGELNFAALAHVSPEDVLIVPEDRICATMIEMLNIEGVVLEPAGALAIDGLRDIKEIEGKTVVAVVSGGNFDFERLPDVKERSLRWAGLKKYYILRMPQRPGALKDFLGILGPDDDIARFEYLKKSARNFGSVLIGIESRKADGFVRIEAEMEAHGFAFEDITDNATLANFIV